jgi:hypothetical protein
MRTGIVTARVLAAGATFEFRLGTPAQLASIRVGDPVWADFQTGKVLFSGFQAVDGIIASRAPVSMPPLR